MFGGTSSHWANGGSLLCKILTNKDLIYLYLHFLVICQFLMVRLSKSIMFNIVCKMLVSLSQTDMGVLIKRNI